MSGKPVGCSVEKCEYNTIGHCSLTNLKIGGAEAHTSDQTRCDSFKKESAMAGMNPFRAMTNSRQASEITEEIACDAVYCGYNGGKYCTLDSIHVSVCCGDGGSTRDTRCDSFRA